jgi:hypothetical protein
MNELDPSAAWFTLELTYGEAKALRNQIGDVPGPRAGPRLIALYRDLDARLRLAGSIDDEPRPQGPPRLRVVRGRVPAKKVYQRRQRRQKPQRTPPENPCLACQGMGIVGGQVCAPCRGFGEAGPPEGA